MMLNLIKIEFRKLLHYRAFWFLFTSYFLLLLLSYSVITNILEGLNSYFPTPSSPNVEASSLLVNFDAICQNITWGVTFLNIIPGILLILSISNDFTYETLKQSIINGLSEKKYVLGKLTYIFMTSVLTSFVVLVLCLMVRNADTELTFSSFKYVAYFGLHLFSYLVFVLFISLLFRKAAISIAFLFAYVWLIEPLLAWKIGAPVSNYLPFQTLNHLNPSSFLSNFSDQMLSTVNGATILTAMAYVVIISIASYYYIKKIDL